MRKTDETMRLPITLKEGEVHLWTNSADLDSSPKENMEILSKDELRKANSFHFEKDAARYACSRAFLRRILGEYLKIEPRMIEFSYNQYGKPYLAGCNIKFNVSHSRGRVLCAITLNDELGVDLEHTEKDFDFIETAEKCFSETELGILKGVPKSKQREAFYKIWTKKEAVVKAIGKGISTPLTEFTVPLKEKGSLVIENKKWHIESLEIGENFAAAIAVGRKPDDLRLIRQYS
jgi:4'-phosphopantetheinyl transferase